MWFILLLAAGFSAGPATTVAHQPLEAGRYLVARRELQDRWFGRTVVVIAEHGPAGTLGFILNRPTRLRLEDALDKIDPALADEPLYFGGPVALRRLAMLSTREIPAGTMIARGLYFSADSASLGPHLDEARNVTRVMMGHAGWAPGQLESEIARGDWYVVDADPAAIFGAGAEAAWRALIDQLDRPPNLAAASVPSPASG